MPDFTVGALSLVNTTTAGDQAPPLVAGLAGGGSVVTWFSSADQNVYAQQYDPAGNRVGGETFVAHAGSGTASGVAGLAGGGYVVLFTEGGPGGPTSVLAQRMDASGHAVGGPTVVASSTNGSLPLSGDSVEALPDGGWLVTFHSEVIPPSPIENGTEYAQRFDASGAAAGGQLTLAQTSGNLQASTAVLPDGEWVTAYNQFVNYHDGIVAATGQFSASGAPEHANTINLAGSTEVAPQVAVLASGHEAVVWFTPDQQPTWYHLQGQLFDASGAPLGAAFDLSNADGLLVGSAPQVTALADGGFVVSWEHSALVSAASSGPSTYTFDLRAQYFDANGNASGAPVQVGPTTTVATTSPPTMHWSVAATPDGGFVVAVDEPGDGLDVYAQKFSPAAASGAPVGTPGNDTLTVPAGSVTIDGGAGTDTVVFDASVASVQSYALGGDTVSITTASGTDTLVNVERVRFADALFGLDTQAPSGSDAGGHVWQAAAVFHAGFGALPGVSDLSRWTADADHTGSMGAMAQDMINAYAPGVSSAGLVTYLYQQLAHATPSADTVQSYVGQIGPGHAFATQGDFVAWAASLPVNADAIAGIVGSAQPLDPVWF